MRSQKNSAWRAFAYGIAASLCSACTSTSARPELHVHVDGAPCDCVRIFRDGVERPANASAGLGSIRLTPNYYGRVFVEAEGPTDAEHVADRSEDAQLVDFDAPAPLWIFPLDFAVEALRKLTGNAKAPVVRLQLATPAEQSDGTLDDSIIRRSVQAVQANAVRR